ncbi:hypothetical protein BDF20DRAFT_599579 [Mycotypha africana]|uniref:uncharacterized protein n=1 Tax=Mycotypha africana TaxID=64632 RepID=UPI002300ABD6|nr:uncharacterized protein BDF20DRAFT_599579 [Mycotypha africana]KAI8975323.1 hypothetical protein BDF20DRAFT_599579 [Mycotypha africana]
MDSVALSIQNKHDCGGDFIPGEACLSAVKKQLKDSGHLKDDRFQYNADGIIKLINVRNLELLLVETSGSYAKIDKAKSNFDHHKGTFGTLAMLKTIADEYNHAENGSLQVNKKGYTSSEITLGLEDVRCLRYIQRQT